MPAPSNATGLQLAGVAVALVGLSVGGYAYTGERVYYLPFFFATIVSILLIVGGITGAAWARAIHGPRQRIQARLARAQARTGTGASARPAAASAPVSASQTVTLTPSAPPQPEPTKTAPEVPARGRARFALSKFKPQALPKPTLPRLRMPTLRFRAKAEPQETALIARGEETMRLACPACAHVFTARGRRPFDATCPQCAFAARIDEEDDAHPAPDRLERLQLECPSCARAFTALGERPIRVTCPGCGFSSTVE